MRDFTFFVTDNQSMFYMSNRFLKEKIYGFHVPQFQLAYIRDKKHPLHKILVELYHDVNYVWWGNQDLEVQEWEGSIK